MDNTAQLKMPQRLSPHQSCCLKNMSSVGPDRGLRSFPLVATRMQSLGPDIVVLSSLGWQSLSLFEGVQPLFLVAALFFSLPLNTFFLSASILSFSPVGDYISQPSLPGLLLVPIPERPQPVSQYENAANIAGYSRIICCQLLL